MLLHWLIQLAGIDTVCRAELDSSLELPLVDVHSNNLGRASHLCALNDCEANGAKTKHGHGGIGFHFASVPYGAEPGANATPKQAGFFKRCLGGDFGTANLTEYSVFAEGRAAHEMINFVSTSVFKSLGTVRHDALPLGSADSWA
eukprot:CAMPEP_0184465094 /NCGR_PEP_ID=MMETSP0740-20130409/60241_1 /TAXON_ID=385413 /ORGANISM="Thalassiosira miniscula, Strain CCMP1093" /LENGTH=144 /DNA_ID=CAMNT_0026839801 /DNA_START=472 /DNA_END=906 /DNA_ORIENTATION=-